VKGLYSSSCLGLRSRRNYALRALALAGAVAFGRGAQAGDPSLGTPPLAASGRAAPPPSPFKLDVTETSIVSQRFDSRAPLPARDHGWGQWLNKLNAQLTYKKFTFGLRLDSTIYWNRPEDRTFVDGGKFDPAFRDSIVADGATRFRNNVYPAKIWGSYKDKGLEITLGDAYAQFGRGLTLSLRKFDELGIDTTARGAKIALQKGPIGLTAIAGFGNPTRVDEASGRAMFVSKPFGANGTGSGIPMFGSDRILGAEISGGRGGPVVLTTRAVRISRCAPYSYSGAGEIKDGLLATPIGTCNDADTSTFLATLPAGLNPLYGAKKVDFVGQSVEVPNLFGHGTLYIEGAIQNYSGSAESGIRGSGNAIYGSFSSTFGAITNTIEVKSYRNFLPVPASVNANRAVEFSNVAYTQLPTTEPLIADSMFGNFNACVDGGRLRTDARVNKHLLVYAAGGYYHTKSEVPGAGCDRYGRYQSELPAGEGQNNVWDGLTGIEYRFDKDRSQLLASIGVRNDRLANGHLYYNERVLNYTFNYYLKGAYSLEFTGRHRMRFEEGQNVKDRGDLQVSVPWAQGFHQTALKIAPKWVIAQGIEYYTITGQPAWYVNGSILYRFTSGSNIKIFAGQQQGGLRCVSGVCRIFPAFEGVRAELTLRY